MFFSILLKLFTSFNSVYGKIQVKGRVRLSEEGGQVLEGKPLGFWSEVKSQLPQVEPS